MEFELIFFLQFGGVRIVGFIGVMALKVPELGQALQGSYHFFVDFQKIFSRFFSCQKNSNVEIK